MKHLLLLLTATTCFLSAVAQVRIPFNVPLPRWKALVTPTMEGQLFKTSDMQSDILICIAGPEYDEYEWHRQSSKPLNEGGTSMVITPGTVLPVKSEGHGLMIEVEFSTYVSGIFNGYTQSYGLKEVEAMPVTIKDLEECTYVVCVPDAEGNITVVLERGTEEHVGWADTFYIGMLKEGYVVFPYTCTVERNPESNHSGILNGKLGYDIDLSKFTLRDVEYILKHAESIEDNVYAVMFAYNTSEGRRAMWFETRLVGDETGTSVSVDDNQIYTQVEQEPTYPGGPAALLACISKNTRYPLVAAESNIQGNVVVKFIVEKDCSITNVEVVKPVDCSLDREAVRVVKALGKMSSPGKVNGRAVRSYYSVPVNFKL